MKSILTLSFVYN